MLPETNTGTAMGDVMRSDTPARLVKSCFAALLEAALSVRRHADGDQPKAISFAGDEMSQRLDVNIWTAGSLPSMRPSFRFRRPARGGWAAKKMPRSLCRTPHLLRA